jgi:hypothetical protein
MPVTRLGKDTTSVTDLEWDGAGFAPAEAQDIWLRFPEQLKEIALEEMRAGNVAWNLLRDESSGHVLVAFSSPPRASPPGPAIRVHSHFAPSNYCYDGTHCTYEDLATGAFLAFDEVGSQNGI